MNVFNSRKKEN
jgi:hypothetical protein